MKNFSVSIYTTTTILQLRILPPTLWLYPYPDLPIRRDSFGHSSNIRRYSLQRRYNPLAFSLVDCKYENAKRGIESKQASMSSVQMASAEIKQDYKTYSILTWRSYRRNRVPLHTKMLMDLIPSSLLCMLGTSLWISMNATCGRRANVASYAKRLKPVIRALSQQNDNKDKRMVTTLSSAIKKNWTTGAEGILYIVPGSCAR